MSQDDDSHPNGNYIVGTKQVIKAISEGRVTKVYLAKDVDPLIQEQITSLCTASKVALEWVTYKSLLGKDCGIDVDAAVAAESKLL